MATMRAESAALAKQKISFSTVLVVITYIHEFKNSIY